MCVCQHVSWLVLLLNTSPKMLRKQANCKNMVNFAKMVDFANYKLAIALNEWYNKYGYKNYIVLFGGKLLAIIGRKALSLTGVNKIVGLQILKKAY